MDQESTFSQSLDSATRTAVGQEGSGPRVPGLTVLAHPDVRRIGERASLTALTAWQEAGISRLEPLFSAPGETERRPLGDRFLSRRPVKLAPAAGGKLQLDVEGASTRVEVDGKLVRDSRELSPAEIERGVVLLLADRVALLLHPVDPTPPLGLSGFGLVGESSGIVTVRQQITSIADVDVPVLLRGETGTGKELVASAIHEASKRRQSRAFVPVNMGAIPPTLAAAELFGAAKGAFTGADRHRTGYFVRADGGTLFLDEIGETPLEVQALLLRTLETGEVQPVGAEALRKVDVRVVSATDARLEAEIEAGRFRAPLLHRLSGFEIRLPPLRERRDDVGLLLLAFLRQELEALGETWRLEDGGDADRPWLAAPTVARLAAYDWPGNVRQLRNVARQLVIGRRGAAQLRITPQIEEILEGPAPSSSSKPYPPTAEEAPALTELAGNAGDKAVVKTLVVTDLVASTTLVERLGDRRSLEVMTRHDRTARRLLPDYDGHEVDKSDGFLLLFDRPSDAVGYALDYQETLAALSLELGTELRARVGIHLGEVFLRRNAPSEVARGAKAVEVEGLAKPMAARLMSLAEGGQTLLSRGAFDLARQSARGEHPLATSEVRWLRHGEYRFKGLPEPVEVFEVGALGTAPFKAPAAFEKAEPAGEEGPGPAPPAPRRTYRRPDEVSEDELVEALERHDYRLQPTAAALGLARTSLYALIEKSSRVRKARDLPREEIESAGERCGGDLDAMAAELEVSRRGLRRRMTELGLK